MTTAAVRFRFGNSVPGFLPDSGRSDDAELIRSRLHTARFSDRSSRFLIVDALLNKAIDEAQAEYGELDARVHAAAPWARTLLHLIPEGLKSPSVWVDTDGEIVVEWIAARDVMLSASIGAGGVVSYAALLGARKYRGKDYILGSIPEQLGHAMVLLEMPIAEKARGG